VTGEARRVTTSVTQRLADLPDMDEVGATAAAEYVDVRIKPREYAVLSG